MRRGPASSGLVLGLIILASGASAQEPPPPGPQRGAAAAESLETVLRERLGAPMESLDQDLFMFGEDFFGAEPQAVRWTDDSAAVVFEWKKWDERRRGTWKYSIDAGGLERLPDDRPAPPRGRWSSDRSRRAWREGAAILVEGPDGQPAREVARLDRRVEEIVWSPDGAFLFLRTEDAVYRTGLESPSFVQVLALKEGPEPKEEEDQPPDPAKDVNAWHRSEQRDLFRVLRERLDRQKAEKAERKSREAAEPKVTAFHSGEGFKIGGVVVSPAGTHAAVSLSKPGKKSRVADMPDFLAEDGYVAMRATRPKVGEETSERRLEVVDLATGTKVKVEEPVEGRDAVAARCAWSPDGRFLLASAASRDDEHAWLLKVDPATGAVSVLHHLEDGAWTLQKGFDLAWLGTTSVAVFLSEASGFTHLWRVDAESGEVRPLTKGAFEVASPQPTPDGRRVFAVATPTSPHVRDLVEIDPETGDLTVLTADGGGRSFVLSPDGARVAEVFSKGNRPWELRIRFLDGEREPVVVTDSPSPAFRSWPSWEDPPIVRIPAGDGASIPARIYRPRRPAPGRPAVCFVHGAGYLQNVHGWWSRYEREYAFHHLLRDSGYTVLDLDYRGSAGYGRAWRTAIRLHMGGRDLEDYADAARWLVENENVAPGRIGIYGGSYGGFLTLMALFTKPGTFAAGAALRPVTDWAHYNDGYTSNILDTPLENPEAYARSSPIRFAEGLKDRLLICHGLVDDNVHAQDTVRLTQRLIELRKTGWEVAYFPAEAHGFRDAASWSDEYRRIRALFDDVLLDAGGTRGRR